MCRSKKKLAPGNCPADRWISLSAVVIAGTALIFTICESRTIRKHQRLSVDPRMHVAFFYTKEWAGFLLDNTGLGPARLEWFTVAVDGEPQPDWPTMFKRLGFDRPPQFEFVIPASKAWFQPNFNMPILKVPPGPDYERLVKESSRIGVGGCYCSIYEECWQFGRGQERLRVESCKARPEKEFGPPQRAKEGISSNNTDAGNG